MTRHTNAMAFRFAVRLLLDAVTSRFSVASQSPPGRPIIAKAERWWRASARAGPYPFSAIMRNRLSGLDVIVPWESVAASEWLRMYQLWHDQ